METNLAGVRVGGKHPPRVMAALNVSPESFFKGSVVTNARALRTRAKAFERAGADFIDVGAMSTAPYLKTAISPTEEARRLSQAIAVLKKSTLLPISADTSRAEPALAALKAGATILNDVRGLRSDTDLPKIARRFKGVILMANPANFPKRSYKRTIADTSWLLQQSLKTARAAGIANNRIVLDPGIGFFRVAKIPWWRWDMELIEGLRRFEKLRHPLLVGISRKSFIGHLMGGKPPEERLAGSLAATALAVINGAAIIRTHDVAETVDLVKVLSLR